MVSNMLRNQLNQKVRQISYDYVFSRLIVAICKYYEMMNSVKNGFGAAKKSEEVLPLFSFNLPIYFSRISQCKLKNQIILRKNYCK